MQSSPQPPLQPLTPKGAAKRESILDQASLIFSEIGFHGTTFREIAQRLGVTHPSLLYYFPSKENLLLEVLRRRDSRSRARNEAAASLADRLELTTIIAEENARVPGLIELYAVISAEATDPAHPAHDYYLERYEYVIAMGVDLFGALATRGLLKPGVRPEAAARLSTAASDGLQLQWLMHRGAVDLPALLAENLDLILVHPYRETIALLRADEPAAPVL